MNDRDEHSRRLSAERRRAQEHLAARAAEYDAVAASSMSEGRDDEHDPDGSTPAVEHALAFGLLAAAQMRLGEIDDAIARLAAGTYGQCEHCGAVIASERMEVMPAAVTCVACPGKAGASGHRESQ